MSHAIEIIDGVASCAYAGQKPWHGLGFEVSNDLTPNEMLKAAHLDWRVNLKPLYFDQRVDGKSTRIKLPSTKALVRDSDNKVLTVVSHVWNPVQNEDAFEFFTEMVQDGGMEMNTAGSLLGGKKVWALAKIKDSFDLRVNGKKTRDSVEGYLLLTNPHEYGHSLDARFTAIRVVCNNTHSLAMRGSSNAVALNHRKVFDAERLKELLGIGHAGMDEYRQAAEFLATKRYTDETVTAYLNKVFPFTGKTDRVMDQVKAIEAQAVGAAQDQMSRTARVCRDILETQPGADFAPGTWWNALNAVTFVTDHVMGHNNDSRVTSAWYGHNRARKDRALQTAVEFANAA